MNFLEAVKAMKEGKKVKRSPHNENYILSIILGEICKKDKKHYSITIIDIEATDWQIVEEKKTLSDKRKEISGLSAPGHFEYNEEDVKKAIKELCDVTNLSSDLRLIFMKNVRKIFGTRLVE